MGIKVELIKAGVKLKKHSPTILSVVGAAGVVATSVLAVRAGRRIDLALEKADSDIVEAALEWEKDAEAVDPREGIERIKVTAKAYAPVVKLIAPVVGCGLLTTAAFLGGHHILKQRNTQLLVAYEALNTMFRKYRETVREDVGEEHEREIHKRSLQRMYDEYERDLIKDSGRSWKLETAAIYGPDNPNFTGNKWIDEQFLSGKQSHFNYLLHQNGFVFLNDVRRSLGLEPTYLGQHLGWLDNEPDVVTNFIDFGHFDHSLQEDGLTPEQRWEGMIYLDFNVDGYIIDKATGGLLSRRGKDIQ